MRVFGSARCDGKIKNKFGGVGRKRTDDIYEVDLRSERTRQSYRRPLIIKGGPSFGRYTVILFSNVCHMKTLVMC